MSAARYAIQKERICDIADVVFPGCKVIFGTSTKPDAMPVWIVDSEENKLCEFPVETSVDELEQMSDAQIEARFRSDYLRNA